LALALLVSANSAWLDIPFVPQEKNGCGAAALSMLHRYWNRPDPGPAAIFNELYSKESRGIRGEDMRRHLESAGYRVFVFKGEWQDLASHTAKGRPLIACLGPNASANLHYVVVAGVDSPNNIVLANDPAGRKLQKYERKEWEKLWRASGYWTLLAVPTSSSR